MRVTRLDAFLRANKLRPAHVAEWAGMSRQQLYRIRHGADLRLNTARHIVGACSYLLGRRVLFSESSARTTGSAGGKGWKRDSRRS